MIMLAATTRMPRAAAMPLVNDAFASHGGWITGHGLFGAMVIVFRFEMAPANLAALARSLAAGGIVLDADSHAAIAAAGDGAGEVPGTLHLAFASGEPDVRQEIPAVPG